MLGKMTYARLFADGSIKISGNLFGPRYLDYYVRKEEEDCSVRRGGKAKWNVSVLALCVHQIDAVDILLW